MLRLNLALNRFAFHWSFPEIVADAKGLFASNGLEANWHDVTPAETVSKTSMYTDLLEGGRADVYHAAEWACINRVLKSDRGWMVAKSMPGKGTLNSSFAIFARKDSGIRSPGQLKGKMISIEEGTGAEYTTIADLEKYLPREEYKLVQTGEPHKRLLSMLRGEVDAASLVGPWSDVARALGLVEVLRTERMNPTTAVVRKETAPEFVRAFFGSVNQAIEAIISGQEGIHEMYVQRVREIIRNLPINIPEKVLEESVHVSRWERWIPYTYADFQRTYRWMVERDLAAPGGTPERTVARYADDVFG